MWGRLSIRRHPANTPAPVSAAVSVLRLSVQTVLQRGIPMTTVRLARWLAAGALIIPASAGAAIVDAAQAIGKAGVESDIGTTRIVVNGKGSAAYDHVSNATVDAWVRVQGNDEPRRPIRFADGEIRIEGGTAAIQKPGAAKIYKVSFPYVAPMSHSVANQRVNPVKLCNDRLKALSGAAREEFLKKGLLFLHADAYSARVRATWLVRRGGFEEHEGHFDTAAIGASIDCRPLAGPKVRTTTSTGDSSGKTGPRAKGPPPTRTAPPPTRTNPDPVRTNPPPVRVSGAAPAGDFDARIRRADREGPGGSVRLFVYNTGPAAAGGCSISWRTNPGGAFQRVANVPEVEPRQTVELASALPDDADSEFRLDCPGEPEGALGNNSVMLE